MTDTYADFDDLSFHGNPRLKKAGDIVDYTPENIIEFKKCMADPVYFASNHIKIVNIDKGLIPIPLYEHQKALLNNFTEHRNNIVLASRQTGKCVCKETLVTVKNKKTGEVKTLKIKDLFTKIK
jgi:hypothetical protein